MISNKKLVLATFLSLGFSLVSGLASASTLKDCQGKVEAARASLLTLKGGKKDQAQQDLVKSTAEEANTCIAGVTG